MKTKQSALKFSIGLALAAMAGSAAASGPQFMMALADTQSPAILAAGGSTLQNKGSSGMASSTYLVADLDEKFKLGLAVNAPFAEQKSYDPTWIARFQATRLEVQSVNLSPSVAYQINDTVSVDAGISYRGIMGDEASHSSLVAGSYDHSYGYNFGTLINVDEQTRVGFAYRSQVKRSLSGAVSYMPTILAGGSMANGDTAAPNSFSSSVVHQINPQLDLLADVTWTGWGILPSPDAIRSIGPLSGTPDNGKNSWRAALGAAQRYGELWTARLGVAYDQTPVSTAQIIDHDRTWFALGGQYKFTNESSLDFGYAHVFVNGVGDGQSQGLTGGLPGTVSNNANIYSLQYGHSF